VNLWPLRNGFKLIKEHGYFYLVLYALFVIYSVGQNKVEVESS
jgi:hypothetical protein